MSVLCKGLGFFRLEGDAVVDVLGGSSLHLISIVA